MHDHCVILKVGVILKDNVASKPSPLLNMVETIGWDTSFQMGVSLHLANRHKNISAVPICVQDVKNQTSFHHEAVLNFQPLV